MKDAMSDAMNGIDIAERAALHRGNHRHRPDSDAALPFSATLAEIERQGAPCAPMANPPLEARPDRYASAPARIEATPKRERRRSTR